MKEIGRFRYKDGDEDDILVVYKTRYGTGNLAVVIETDKGEAYATVSENHHPRLDLDLDEFAVQTRNMTPGLVRALIASGLFEVVGTVMFGPFDTGEPIWRLKSI